MQSGLFENPTFRAAPKALTARAETLGLFLFLLGEDEPSLETAGESCWNEFVAGSHSTIAVGRAGRAGVKGPGDPPAKTHTVSELAS